MPPSIYSFIKEEEHRFQTEEIQVGDNWWWNFRNHVQMIFHLKHGVFFTGQNNWLRAFKKIMSPILKTSYWLEDIEVKDVNFYIESKNGRELSFLIKKYHDEVYVKKHDLDTLFDEITESDIDYGGALVHNADTPQGVEVLPLVNVAFCDQTDILGGVIAFKYSFSPSKLKKMSKVGWGDKKNGATISIDELITLVNENKNTSSLPQDNKSTSKNIDVYILHGDMPEHYLEDNNNMEDVDEQLQIVAFYTDKHKNREGVTLYRQKDNNELWFHSSKKVTNRALGEGDGESLLHPQIWENFLTIHKMNLLEAGSKIPLWTTDDELANKNELKDQDNLFLNKLGENKQIGVLNTINPAQVQMFSNSINEWYEQGQLVGAAFDPLMGKEASSGTTFRGQERTVAQGQGFHKRRMGQRAKFIEKLYREKFIPDMVKEIQSGKKFLATLTADEMAWVMERVVDNFVNEAVINKMLNEQHPEELTSYEDYKEQLKQQYTKEFYKKGNKWLFETLKSEFNGIEIKIGINVAGKQKDLVGLSDKALSIIQFAFQDPDRFQRTLQIPGMTKSFNDILEFSGISPVDFFTVASIPSPVQSPIPSNMAQLPVMQNNGGQ